MTYFNGYGRPYRQMSPQQRVQRANMQNMYRQPKVRYAVVFPNGFFACRKGGLHQVPNIMMATHFRSQDEAQEVINRCPGSYLTLVPPQFYK